MAEKRVFYCFDGSLGQLLIHQVLIYFFFNSVVVFQNDLSHFDFEKLKKKNEHNTNILSRHL